MSEKILFSKKYDKTHSTKESEKSTDVTHESRADAKAMLSVILNNITYVSIPEKQEMVYRFVQDAINFSVEYEMDIEVTELLHDINIHLSFDDFGIFTFLKDVIYNADDILIRHNTNDRDITLTLLFQTHKAVSRSELNEQNGL